jgi:glutaredoxin
MTCAIATALLLSFFPAAALQADLRCVDQLATSLYSSIQERHVLLLYYTTYCPYSQKVLRYLNQIHKTLPMKNLDSDNQARIELKKLGGKMQVPCLSIDGQPMYDSGAIIEWLSQHQDELQPA